MNVDEMRLKNTLSHEVHVTRHHKKDEDYAPSVHAHRLCNLRVSVFVSLYLLLMWFVSCLSSVLVLLFMLYSYSFRSQFSVVGGILFTFFGHMDMMSQEKGSDSESQGERSPSVTASGKKKEITVHLLWKTQGPASSNPPFEVHIC